MKFEIKREPSQEIEVISLEIIEINKPSIWQHWKALGTAALAGSLVTIAGFNWFYQYDLDKIEGSVQINRSTTIILGSKHEQEGNRSGTNGITPTGN